MIVPTPEEAGQMVSAGADRKVRAGWKPAPRWDVRIVEGFGTDREVGPYGEKRPVP